MSQLSVKFNLVRSVSLTPSTQLYDLYKSCHQDKHAIVQMKNEWGHLIIWGDVAQKHNDAKIWHSVQINQYPIVAGRSWIFINRLTRTVFAGSDNFGLFPVFLYQNSDTIIIASSRQALVKQLGKPLSLNTDAMRCMLTFGQLFNESSILENTQHIGASSTFSLSLSPERLYELKTNSLIGFPRDNKASFKDALEAVVESVRCSVLNCENPMLSLSGGLDSRLILACCEALNIKLPALCYGNKLSADAKIASELAKACNISLTMSNDLIGHVTEKNSRRIAFAGQGEVPIHHAHALIDESLVEETKHHTLLTGTGAETFRAFYYDRGMPGFSAFGLKCLNKLTMPRVKRYITEEYGKTASAAYTLFPQHADQLYSQVSELLMAFSDSTFSAAQYADHFYLRVRAARMVVAGQQLLDEDYNRTHPFLSPDVVKSIGSLPARYKLSSTFHRKAICKLAPKLGNIEWDKTSRPLNQGLTFFQRYPGLASRLGLKHFFGKKAAPMFQYKYNEKTSHSLVTILKYAGVDSTLNIKECYNEMEKAGTLAHALGLAAVWQHLLNE
jgi:asparagine synthase (glutamine-hydrolysing)